MGTLPMQSTSQPFANPQATFMGDSGVEQNENSLYGDMTLINNRISIYNQPQNRNFASASYLNSPQQMSTPIAMRTKQEFNAAYPNTQPFGSRSNVQNQFQQPHQPFGSQQNTDNISQQLKQKFQSPQAVQQPLQPQKPTQQSECEIHFSGKHDAIYIYLARLLAPIWDLKLLTELSTTRKTNDSLDSGTTSLALNDSFLFASFTDITIGWYLNKLNELRRFIEINFPQLKTLQHSNLSASLFGFGNTSSVPTSSSNQAGLRNPNLAQLGKFQQRFATNFSSMPLNMATLTNLTSNAAPMGVGHHLPITEEKLAVEIENGSIYLIKQFLNRIIEIFGLWKILDEHKFHFISSKLDKQTILLMMSMHVKTFLLADDGLLEQLINALLYRYIDDNACTDLLNQSLKQMCPSLYTNENAIFSKACEKLKQALNNKNDNYERDRLLKEAVDLMKQIGNVANLPQVCDMLYMAGCFEAIFELCLTAAEKRDPQNIALFYYTKSEPPEDVQGQHYYSLRYDCYKCMLDCLNALVKMPAVSLAQPNIQNMRLINTKEKLEEQINSLIKYVTNSKDELANVSLFKWMINSGFEKKLVTLDSPYLDSYLLREIKEQTKNRIYLDLLWKHYDYKKDYQNAAKVLTALAEKYW